MARAPSLRAYGYWPMALSIVEAENWKVSAYDGFTERNPRYRLDLLWIWCAAFAIGCQQGLDDQRVLCVCISQGVRLFSRESKTGPRVRRQSMQKYQGISILFFSRQSKARPRQAVIAKWQTKQWCKKGEISARQRSKKQVQRSVPRVSRVERLTLREASRYRFNTDCQKAFAGARIGSDGAHH